MIKFGKIYIKRYKKEKDKIIGMIYGVEKYAWLPIRLKNGKWFWLGKYYKYYDGGEDSKGFWLNYCAVTPISRNYLSRSSSHVKIKIT